jgi:hypothetical protein
MACSPALRTPLALLRISIQFHRARRIWDSHLGKLCRSRGDGEEDVHVSGSPRASWLGEGRVRAAILFGRSTGPLTQGW